MSGFLLQSVISQKNIDLLVKLSNDIRPEVHCRAKVMLEVARFRPGKRRRLKFLASQRPDLLRELMRLFDLPDYYYDEGGIPDSFLEEDVLGTMDCDSALHSEKQFGDCGAKETPQWMAPDFDAPLEDFRDYME